jgi:hypothetical protein
MTGRRPTPKYQVFVSSTYDDLKEERKAVTWEVLKANHIPVGMENFAASDDRGWKTIQRAIDRSDYYVVIVAGMYGSVDPETGISWTQREYEYALAKGVPVLAFVRDEGTLLAKMTEKDPKRASLLAGFKAKLNNHHRKTWSELGDLRVEVVHALRNQIDVDEESETPRPGWYRGDEIPTGLAVEEFARLSAENSDLRSKLSTMEQAKEMLVLLRDDGSPVADESYAVPSYSIEDSDQRTGQSQRPFNPLALVSRGAFVETEEVAAYLRDLSFVHWVKLKLKNDGARPARNIVAKFKAEDAEGLALNDLERPTNPYAVVASVRLTPFYFKATEHVYVSSYDEGAAPWVEQRIQQVGVGGTESFIAMGFRGRGLSSGTFTVTLDYEIRSEDGVLAEGSFAETIKVGATRKVLKPSEVMG